MRRYVAALYVARTAAVKEHGAAEHLHQGGMVARRQLRRQLAPIPVHRLSQAELYKLMAQKGDRDGAAQRLGDALFADLHHRLQVMAEPAQVAALLIRQKRSRT